MTASRAPGACWRESQATNVPRVPGPRALQSSAPGDQRRRLDHERPVESEACGRRRCPCKPCKRKHTVCAGTRPEAWAGSSNAKRRRHRRGLRGRGSRRPPPRPRDLRDRLPGQRHMRLHPRELGRGEHAVAAPRGAVAHVRPIADTFVQLDGSGPYGSAANINVKYAGNSYTTRKGLVEMPRRRRASSLRRSTSPTIVKYPRGSFGLSSCSSRRSNERDARTW